jgi:lysophospholipase L1-like esterase
MTNRGLYKGTGTQDLRLDNKKIKGLALPVDARDAASKRHVREGDSAVPSYVAGRDARYSFSPLQGVYNYKSENTRHADQGLTNASRGTGTTGPADSSQAGYTRELVIGDSVTAGCTGGAASNITYSRTEAWPYAMRDTMSLWGIPSNGTGIYRCQDGSITNTQFWSTTGTWTGGSNVTFISSTTVGATATCTVDRPGTIVDVFYADGFSGTFTISVNGASSGAGFATVTAAGVSRTGKKRLNLTGGAFRPYPGSTIKIAVTTAGTGVGIIGVSVWTPNGGLVIDNVAQGGSKAGGVADRTSWTETTNVGAPWNVFGGNYKGGISGQRLTSTTITTTTGSASITLGSGILDADAHTGVPIDFVPDVTKGIAFPPGTYIATVNSSTTATLSNLALTTNSANQTAYIDRDPSAVHICLGGNDLQNGRTGAQIAGDLTTLVGRIRAQWPQTDVILHLENELAPANASAAAELDMQQNMYALADTLNVPLYDWRDRAGNYATAMSNGIYADAVAHMTPAMYTNLGCCLAFARCIAGAGPAQAVRGPTLDNDVTPKWYTDGFTRFQTPLVANGNTFTATANLTYNVPLPPNTLQVGDTIELECYGTYTATVVGAILAKMYLGPLGTVGGDTLIATSPTTANAGATGAAFHLQGIATVRTIGSSGTLEVVVYAHLDNTAIRISAPTQVTIDTTTRNYLSLMGQCSGGTSPVGTPNMGYHSTIKKG